MGIKYVNPVSVAKRIVVLIGVRVTQAFIAAMQLTIVSERLIDGNMLWINNPRAVPQKNSGIINPPRHPEVTVIAMAIILNTSTATRNLMVKSPTSKVSISKWLK